MIKFTTVICTLLSIYIGNCQCKFEYISNDTFFQDYIEEIYHNSTSQLIVTIGSQIIRNVANENFYNAPIFQSFDYCGKQIDKTSYRFIGSTKIIHKALPTHNSYKNEPIGNTSIQLSDDEFLMAEIGYDTIKLKYQLILVTVNSSGIIQRSSFVQLNDFELNQRIVKNVIHSNNGNFIVLLWDKWFQYEFIYFNSELNLAESKMFAINIGIHTIRYLNPSTFICTGLNDPNSTFLIYSLDTSGSFNWIIKPSQESGSARELLINNQKIYTVGNTIGKGILFICDLDGQNQRNYIYDSIFCDQRLCSIHKSKSGDLIIGGYIKHCSTDDKRGTDVMIQRVDTHGKFIGSVAFNITNSLGTSGSNGFFNDFGGFRVLEMESDFIITNGISKYTNPYPGGVMHDDALLIQSKISDTIIVNNNSEIDEDSLVLQSNLIKSHLLLQGNIQNLYRYSVYNTNGMLILEGNLNSNSVELMNISAGLYFLVLQFKNDSKKVLRFIKL